jgi:hypothetical protein
LKFTFYLTHPSWRKIEIGKTLYWIRYILSLTQDPYMYEVSNIWIFVPKLISKLGICVIKELLQNTPWKGHHLN